MVDVFIPGDDPVQIVHQMKTALTHDEIMSVSEKVPGECRAATAIRKLRMERDRFKSALEKIANQPKPPDVAATDGENLITWLIETAEVALNPVNDPVQGRGYKVRDK